MKSDKSDRCQWPKCGEPSTIIYLDSGLCEKHWNKICEMPTEKAYKKLKIVPKNTTETDAANLE